MVKSTKVRSRETKEPLQVTAGLRVREKLEAEDFLTNVEVMRLRDELQQRAYDRKLRNRIVWWVLSSVAFEGLLILLHSIGLVTLPQAVVIAITVMLGGSGLAAALLIIVRDLFPKK